MALFASAAPPSAAETARMLDEILARPEFGVRRSSLFEWITERLIEFFGALGLSADQWRTLTTLVMVVGALLIVGVGLLVFLLVRRGISRRAERHAARGGGALPGPDRVRAELAAAEARGDYPAALCNLFVLYLYSLDALKMIALADGKTNRQYRAELRRARYASLDLFDRFAHDYALIRFGGFPADASLYGAWRDTVAPLISDGAEAAS